MAILRVLAGQNPGQELTLEGPRCVLGRHPNCDIKLEDGSVSREHAALTLVDGRIAPVEDRWERMVTGTPWVASAIVSVPEETVEVCAGPEAAESLSHAAYGHTGIREFFAHVRFHKHEDGQIVIHMLVELYARDADEAAQVLEDAARGELTIASLAEESRPPASSPNGPH